jgi:hypothetical protein
LTGYYKKYSLVEYHRRMVEHTYNQQEIPYDAWAVIAYFLPIKFVTSVLYLSKEIQKTVVDSIAHDTQFFITIVSRGFLEHNGQAGVAKLFLSSKQFNPSDLNNIMIRFAAQQGHTEIVRLLLNDNRVDPTSYNNYALRIALDRGHTEIVQMLSHDERVKPLKSVLSDSRTFIQ